jgi:hypothetical protein
LNITEKVSQMNWTAAESLMNVPETFAFELLSMDVISSEDLDSINQTLSSLEE